MMSKMKRDIKVLLVFIIVASPGKRLPNVRISVLFACLYRNDDSSVYRDSGITHISPFHWM